MLTALEMIPCSADRIRAELVECRPGMQLELQRKHRCVLWLGGSGASVGLSSGPQSSRQQIAAISHLRGSIGRPAPDAFGRLVTQRLNSQIRIQGNRGPGARSGPGASSRVVEIAWQAQVRRTPWMRCVCAVDRSAAAGLSTIIFTDGLAIRHCALSLLSWWQSVSLKARGGFQSEA